MTTVQPRPQPVVEAGQLAGNVLGVLTGFAGIFATLGVVTHWPWALGAAAALTAAAAGLSKFMPAITAAGAAALVTPLEDPRDHLGKRLTVDPEEYGRHAAPVLEDGLPAPVKDDKWQPWDELAWYGKGGRIGEGLPDAPALIHPDDRFVCLADVYNAIRTDTQEIPRVTRRPLGRKPPTNAPRIKLTASMVPAAAYSPPPSVDWYSHVPASSWGMDGNDTVGDCTCAEVDHSTKARQVAAGNPEVKSSATEVLAAYSAITGYNPNKPSTDQGAVMQDVRDFWRKNGITLGGKLDKVTLFAEVDHTDLTLIKWCVSRFGAVALGINFPDSAMDQFDAGQPWDVVRGAQIEGGHAISMVGYDAQYAYVVTWGRVQPMTWRFLQTYTEEAWTDIASSDWINQQTGQDPLGEVAYALGQQFEAVTGKANPFPAPTPQPIPQPPAPTPSPGPAPSPSPGTVAVSSGLAADVTAWAKRALTRKDDSHADKAVAHEWLAEVPS